MFAKTAEFEIARIETMLLNDGRDPGFSGFATTWLQFAAVGVQDGEEKIIARSERIPLPNMTGAQAFTPKKNDIGHQNVLNNFINRLKKDKWTASPVEDRDWWQYELKRPAAA